ncbi:MAG: hypothetical protein PHI40_04710, partial [Caldisericia bacterium]|nr:hypothetical protein [Caldisericia bacterium]
MKKKVLFFLVGFFVVAVILVWFLFATGVHVYGTIEDALTQKPISNVSVVLGKQTLFSDDKGKFNAYTSLMPKQIISFTKEGYKPLTKPVSFSRIIESKEYKIVLEPLSYVNIINSITEDLQTYSSFVFQSSWQQYINMPDQEITYTKYVLDPQGVVYCKMLTDDNKGKAVSEKEIIIAPQKIYYKTLRDEDWVSFDASEIRGTELQKPQDLLILFNASMEDPSEFREEELVNWYINEDGSISKEPLNNQEPQVYPLRKFVATWPTGKTEQSAILYLTEQGYDLVAGELHITAPIGLDEDKPGRMNEQIITFKLSMM